MSCKLSGLTAQEYFTKLSGVLFGSWLLIVGLLKWYGGATAFVYQMMSPMFESSILPHFLVVLASWLIVVAEPTLGVLLILGKKKRCVWTLTAILMFVLNFGLTVLQKPELGSVISANWFYLTFALVNGALSCGADSCCKTETACCNKEKTSCCS